MNGLLFVVTYREFQTANQKKKEKGGLIFQAAMYSIASVLTTDSHNATMRQ